MAAVGVKSRMSENSTVRSWVWGAAAEPASWACSRSATDGEK